MGFNPFKMQEMLEQAKKQAEELQQQMAATIVEASAGGGSVQVKMNGQKHLLSIKIEKAVMESGDVEMLQDLIIAAVSEANRKVDDAMKSTIGGMLGGLPGGLPF